MKMRTLNLSEVTAIGGEDVSVVNVLIFIEPSQFAVHATSDAYVSFHVLSYSLCVTCLSMRKVIIALLQD
jgi:hypothetical protein